MKKLFFLVCINLLMIRAFAAVHPPGEATKSNTEMPFQLSTLSITVDQQVSYDLYAPVFVLQAVPSMDTWQYTSTAADKIAEGCVTVALVPEVFYDKLTGSAGGIADKQCAETLGLNFYLPDQGHFWRLLLNRHDVNQYRSQKTEIKELTLLNCNLKFPLPE